jgi:AcrR family transcriptional regulator
MKERSIMMARTVKEKEYAERRNDILQVAQKLVYSKGYDQMSIQDILDELKISKGAFYHYFDSKQALLSAMIDYAVQESMVIIGPIVKDPDLPALPKFMKFFNSAATWKTDRKDFLLAIYRAWYSDDNALLRLKITASSAEQFCPLLSEIIYQGIAEGVFQCTYPEQLGSVVFSLLLGMGDAIGSKLMAIIDCPPADSQRFQLLTYFEEILDTYTDAFERVLGAPQGSLKLMDREMLKKWVLPTQKNSGTVNDPVFEQTSEIFVQKE